MFSEEYSQLKDLLSITHSSAPRGTDSAPLIFTSKENWIPVGCQDSSGGGGGETLMEEQPGESDNEGETAAMEG